MRENASEPSGERAPTVPLVDLPLLHRTIGPKILDDVATLIQTGAFINGPAVSRFEEAFADYCGTEACVGLSSGLDALRLGLLGFGLERGDEVVAPAHTFIATVEAVRQAGALPVLVDISEADHNIDPEGVKAALTTNTRALLPVHLYGQLADMRRLVAIAHHAGGIPVIEDAAQAHGAERDGLRAGGAGALGAFSFYPTKNLGALGDAGAVTTDDPQVAARVRALREHGKLEKNDHAIDGYTARLDTIQALALLHKLPLLDGWNDKRCSAAEFYTYHLSGLGDLQLPPVPEGSRPVWHLFVIRTADPDRLASFLAARGVGSGRHYPRPVHLTSALAHLGYRPGEFPVSEAVAAECLSLPIHPGISEHQLEGVVAALRLYFSSPRR
jgi:dTDP-4-amino-4,6-dideoxygalactose transaminase